MVTRLVHLIRPLHNNRHNTDDTLGPRGEQRDYLREAHRGRTDAWARPIEAVANGPVACFARPRTLVMRGLCRTLFVLAVAAEIVRISGYRVTKNRRPWRKNVLAVQYPNPIRTVFPTFHKDSQQLTGFSPYSSVRNLSQSSQFNFAKPFAKPFWLRNSARNVRLWQRSNVVSRMPSRLSSMGKIRAGHGRMRPFFAISELG